MVDSSRIIYADKDAQEWITRRSRLDWTIVRPSVLTNGPRTGAYRVLVDARLALWVHLTRRRRGLPRQADRRRKPYSQDPSTDRLTVVTIVTSPDRTTAITTPTPRRG
jgi:hypothetical protein